MRPLSIFHRCFTRKLIVESHSPQPLVLFALMIQHNIVSTVVTIHCPPHSYPRSYAYFRCYRWGFWWYDPRCKYGTASKKISFVSFPPVLLYYYHKKKLLFLLLLLLLLELCHNDQTKHVDIGIMNKCEFRRRRVICNLHWTAASQGSTSAGNILVPNLTIHSGGCNRLTYIFEGNIFILICWFF